MPPKTQAVPRSWYGPPCKVCQRPTVADAWMQTPNAIANAIPDRALVKLCWGSPGCIECREHAAKRLVTS